MKLLTDKFMLNAPRSRCAGIRGVGINMFVCDGLLTSYYISRWISMEWEI